MGNLSKTEDELEMIETSSAYVESNLLNIS